MAQESKRGQSEQKLKSGTTAHIFLVFFSRLFWENSPFCAAGKERIIVLIKTNSDSCKSNSPIAPKRKRSEIWIWYIYSNIYLFFFSSCGMGLVTVCQGIFFFLHAQKTDYLARLFRSCYKNAVKENVWKRMRFKVVFHLPSQTPSSANRGAPINLCYKEKQEKQTNNPMNEAKSPLAFGSISNAL